MKSTSHIHLSEPCQSIAQIYRSFSPLHWPSALLDNTGQFVQTKNAGVVFIGSQTSSSLFLKKTLVVESLASLPPSLPYHLNQTEGSGKEWNWTGREGQEVGRGLWKAHLWKGGIVSGPHQSALTLPTPAFPSIHTDTNAHTAVVMWKTLNSFGLQLIAFIWLETYLQLKVSTCLIDV